MPGTRSEPFAFLSTVMSLLEGLLVMKDIFVIRHGQSEHHVRNMIGGWTDLPLTPLGLNQAIRLAEHLAAVIGNRTVSLFSSDLQRASMTAAAVAKRFEIEVNEDAGLRELNNGRARGLSISEAKAIELPRTEPAVDWTPYPEAESWRQMSDRIAQCMDRLAKELEQSAIIVTHAGSASAIVKWWLRLPEPIRYGIEFEFRPCSVTELTENEWSERVIVRLNDIAHL
jgi:2,3-bisphosphoglycerate-dependent phosphoglycerate mutase